MALDADSLVADPLRVLTRRILILHWIIGIPLTRVDGWYTIVINRINMNLKFVYLENSIPAKYCVIQPLNRPAAG